MAKYSKADIGLIQLRAAIQLFNDKDFVSSLTLGAVAEEIFAGYLRIQSEETNSPYFTAAELDGSMFELFENILGIRNYPSYRNRVRNELKHHGDESNKEIVGADFEQISRTHICGAITNYSFWKGEMPHDKTVQAFCDKVGLRIG